MLTTIQVDLVAKQRLDLLKKKYGATSYNEVILRMTDEGKNEVRKMFGSMPDLVWNKSTDRMRFKHE